MTQEEFIVRHPCCARDVATDTECEYGAKPVRGVFGVVPLCNGHKGLLTRQGLEKFERRHGGCLADIGAAYAEAYRQAYWRELAPIGEAVRARKR